MNHILSTSFWVTLGFSLWACGFDSKTAGSASETTNGSVTAVIQDSTGKTFPGAIASLIQTDANQMWQGVSDSSGQIVFSNVPVGSYRLVVRDSAGVLASLSPALEVTGGQETVLPSLELAQESQLRLLASDLPFAVGDKFWLPGTDVVYWVKAIDVTNGFIVIPDVPKGSYIQLFYAPGGQGSIPLLHQTLEVNTPEVLVQPDFASYTAIPQGFVTYQRAPQSVLGGSQDTVVVSDSAGLVKALADDKPRVVQIQGTLRMARAYLRVHSNKTIEGLGDSAQLSGFGLHISGDSNIVIRNLSFEGGPDDAISIEESRYVWVDHNHFENYGDGLVDIKRASDYITVSWNVFTNNPTASLVGHSDSNGEQDSTHLLVTYHHNWFYKLGNAAPRARYGTLHSYNNLYDSLNSYAIVSAQWARTVVEGNYFRNVPSPTRFDHVSPMPGELLFSSTNILVNSGEPQASGAAFDPNLYYDFTLQPTAEIPERVRWGAGPGKW